MSSDSTTAEETQSDENPSDLAASDESTSDQAASERSAQRIFFALLFGIVALGVLHVLYYFPRTVDDMFIYLRYAENAAQGHGLVYNLGEPVEGYSGPLWMLWLTLGEYAGVGGVSWTKFLGAISLFCLGWGTYRLGRERFELKRTPALLPLLFLAANSYIIAWAMWGLETPAYLAFIVWTMVAMHRQAKSPSKKSFALLTFSAAGLLLSRPEAPLFAGVIGIAEVLGASGRDELKLRLKRLLPPSLAATGVLAAYILFRHSYFGLWLPHTHYAKEGGGFDVENLAPFVAQGSSAVEVVLFVLCVVAGIYLFRKKRDGLFVLVVLGTAFFVGLVERDWMPNVRHFLPVQVLLPLVLLGAAQRHKWLMSGAVAVLVLASFDIAKIDSRYSVSDFHSHGRGENWRRPKTSEAWADARAALQGEWPDHVKAMHPYQNGMITQVYDLIEADERPLEDVWFIARDIGRVGWLTPVRVFDTDGLFTPDVVELGAETVESDIILRAFERPIAMSELYGPWATAIRLPEVRSHYRTHPDHSHLGARDIPRPSPEQILERYEYALGRLPSAYSLMTLYGEGVGAAVERRVELVRQLAGDAAGAVLDEAPAFSNPAVRLDDAVDLLGCEVPSEAAAGEDLSIACYFRVIRALPRNFDVFVHVIGGTFIHGDHAPVGGFLPTSEWPEGRIVRDRFRVHVPDDYHGELSPRIGLYAGSRRARAVAVAGDDAGVIDEDGRIILESIRVP